MSNSLKYLKQFVQRINSSSVLSGNNASGVIGNSSTKVEAQLNNLKNVAVEKYNTVFKGVNDLKIIQDINKAALKEPSPLPERLVNWWKWYQKLTGLEDVESAQRRVVVIQDKLFECQDKRRKLTYESSVVTDRLKQIYCELIQTRREDPKYPQLTIMENKELQEQTRIFDQLKFLENDEKDHFTQLATAIKEYHDKQTMNAQKYKYLSIVASSLLAIISLCASMVYNNKRIREMKTTVIQAQKENDSLFKAYFQSLDDKLSSGFVKMQNQFGTQSQQSAPELANIVDACKHQTQTNNSAQYEVIARGVLIMSLVYIIAKFFTG